MGVVGGAVQRVDHPAPVGVGSVGSSSLFGEDGVSGALRLLNSLRGQRRTGRSARMLFDVLGDMWVINRNPYIQDDLITDQKRWKSLINTLHERLDQVVSRAAGNQQALQLADAGRKAIIEFEAGLSDCRQMRQKAKRR